MIVFYNKPLLRFLAVLAGVALVYVGYHYTIGMEKVLGRQGLLDALAIFAYVAASFLVLVVAEIADSHYVRAFGGLSLAAGMITAWVFVSSDLPQLAPEESASIVGVFLVGAFLGVAYLAIVVVRLVLDRIYLGRPLISEAARIGKYQGPVEPPAYREPAAPVSVASDTCPFCGEKFDALGKCACSRIGDAAASPAAAAAQHKADAPAEIHQAPVTRLVGIGGAYSGEVYDLAPGEVSIGRGEGSTICLSGDAQVSRKHARIIVTEDMLAVIEDLGSTNGTSVGGKKIAGSPIAPGIVIGIGSTTFKVE